MREPPRHPRLLEADAWAAENRDLLEAAFAGFLADGEWPTLESLQHQFEVSGCNVDIAQLAWSMPQALGFAEQQRLLLLVRGMSHVSAAAPLLERWCAVLVFCYRRWHEDPTAELTREDVMDLSQGNESTTHLLSKILERESWPFGSGHGGPDDDWAREIISRVRDARGASSFAEVLAVRDAVEFPFIPAAGAEAPEVVEENPGGAGRIRRALKLLSENALAATIIGGVVLALGAFAIREIAKGGDGDHSAANSGTPYVSGRTWPEKAGSGGARTFSQPAGATEGRAVGPNESVRVACKIYKPEPESVLPDGYWYRLASEPWAGRFYAPANSFWNGDIPGQKPYVHNTDLAVPDC